LVRPRPPPRQNGFWQAPAGAGIEDDMNTRTEPGAPPGVITVPGLHGSEGAHWQSWLERQYANSKRVVQDDWGAPHLDTWADALGALLARETAPVVLAAHSFGCLAAAHALSRGTASANVAGVLFVAPASPEKFRFAGSFAARRLNVPSIVVGSESDPWMPLGHARELAWQLGSAFLNLGDAGHINTASGYGPWPRAKYLVDTLAHYAAPARDGEVFRFTPEDALTH
jgi:predicted alpha/beta hydrolase family esterase